MQARSGLPKLPELADHLTRGVAIQQAPPPRRGGGLLEGSLCPDSVDLGTSASRFTLGKGHEKLVREQCEICARWTLDFAYVPGRCGGSAAGHFVCGRCEREATANSFVRQTLKGWLRGKWQKWWRRAKVCSGLARVPGLRLDLSRPLRGRGVNRGLTSRRGCARAPSGDPSHLS
jgi:hypothetical protein